MVSKRGILEIVGKKERNTKINLETIGLIKDFYLRDECSRICAGKKDVKSFRIDGEKVKLPKRLLLANIGELYAILKRNIQR